ncbi:DUF645 family protein [Vibrio tarriae]|uniref:DUF645 family protein n=1 Tax=Vibrio tarriae TaxID=2014742 RepID=UPI003AF326AE
MSDADLVESIESSLVSKSLKTSKPRCFNIAGCSTLAAWFTNSCIIAEILLSLSRILNRGQLNLIVLSFGRQLHRFWR